MARTSTSRTDNSDLVTMPKLLSRRVLVNIRRDSQTTTPRVVWQHELPILEAVYGEGEVVTVEPEKLDDEYNPRPSRELLIHNKEQDRIPPPSESSGIGHVFIGSPAIEYERLVGAYGMHPEIRQSWVEHVYGRFQDQKFTAVIGSPALDDLPESQLRQLVIDHGGPDMAKATKAEDLVKVAAELGVEIA